MLRLRFWIFLTGFTLLGLHAGAADYTWNGGTEANYTLNDWASGSKWSGGVAPGNGDTAYISNGNVYIPSNVIGGNTYPLNVNIHVSGTGRLDLGDILGPTNQIFFGVGHATNFPFTPSSATFTQSSGNVYNNLRGDQLDGFLCFGLGNQGSATYTQTGGVFESAGGATASSGGGMTWGALGGSGTYNLFGGDFIISAQRGALVFGSGEPYTPPAPYNTTLQDAGTGIWNVSGATTSATVYGNMVLGKMNGSQGTLNLSGGTVTFNAAVTASDPDVPFSEWDTPVVIAGYDGTGAINISGGTLEINNNSEAGIYGGNLYLGLSNELAANGTVTQTDGRVVASNLVMGMTDTMRVTSEYAISGGELTLRESVYFGSGTNGGSNSARMAISDNAKVNVGGDFIFGKDFYDPGKLFLEDASRPALNSHTGVGGGFVAIKGGEFNVGGQFASNSGGTVDIYGSAAKINVGEYNTGSEDIYTMFIFDRNGFSTINVAGAACPTGFKTALSEAFISLQKDTIDVISAGSFTQTPSKITSIYFDLAQEVVRENEKDILRLSIASTDYSWNLDLENEILFDDKNPDVLYQGTMRVEGTDQDLRLYVWDRSYKTYDLSSEKANAIVQFLNDQQVDAGVKFYVANSNQIFLQNGYLGEEGYAYFAWNFTAMKIQVGSYSITGFGTIPVPEPASWVLLLLGAGAVFYFRKKASR